MPIPTFVINLLSRTDRKAHIITEFAGRDEYDMSIVEACIHEHGSIGLWETMLKIVRHAVDNDLEYVLICEDDHQFTEAYSYEGLSVAIEQARAMKADVLCGGISWMQTGVAVTEELFWVEKFTGTQFMFVFKQFYHSMLSVIFTVMDSADYKISSMTNRKFVVYPFMSIQKEFGYSDATPQNIQIGRVDELFESTSQNFYTLNDVARYFSGLRSQVALPIAPYELATATVSTFVINLPEREERRAHIIEQFAGRPEFDVTIIDAIKHEVGALGLWLSIRKIVETALANDDDVIIIAEDDHEFTPAYSRYTFMRNIIETAQLGIEYLSGGCSHFEHAVPVTSGLYWVSFFQATQFIVLYRPAFQKILDAPFDDSVVADLQLSHMFANKMIVYPAISTQKNFGYSDVTSSHNQNKNLVFSMFQHTKMRLERINEMMTEQEAFCLP
ncbi:hypothetical protein MKQ68_11530 [Chitinophaga horti]|uniref:Glycosyltransferase family 25 (LPS biosynthesis protein) n=1 Tax=Chitinophaga horti TaxID=2920382 RepID=A0ABY6J7S1_9BACT|nr:hypothetical protein [Chitinophaga horti]UYQ95733.1 hypothetical protein MKQ68_11530 [Chitinophaga horti]